MIGCKPSGRHFISSRYGWWFELQFFTMKAHLFVRGDLRYLTAHGSKPFYSACCHRPAGLISDCFPSTGKQFLFLWCVLAHDIVRSLARLTMFKSVSALWPYSVGSMAAVTGTILARCVRLMHARMKESLNFSIDYCITNLARFGAE